MTVDMKRPAARVRNIFFMGPSYQFSGSRVNWVFLYYELMQAPFSIGTDIVEVFRIRKLSRSKLFLNRVFTAAEQEYCRGKKNSAQHLAVRFAAKEAVWKALSGLKIRGIGHKEIGVKRALDGRPSAALSPRLKKYEKRISLSLSHTDRYALAVALFQGP